MTAKGFKSEQAVRPQSMTVNAVTAQMNADLKASGVSTPAQRKKMLVKPYTAQQMEKITGFKVPGYEIPYFEQSGKKNCFSRYKFLEPVGENQQRYIQLPNTPNSIYLHPAADWSKISQDEDVPIYITEGEKKAACGCINGFATIGLGGVWNIFVEGNYVDEFYDPELFRWQGRQVIIVFDAPDLDRNENVAMALRRLDACLSSQGAITHIKKLPLLENQSKTGLDDFIVAKGKKAFEQIPNEIIDQRKYDSLGINPCVPRMNRQMVFLQGGNRTPIVLVNNEAKELGLASVQSMRDEYKPRKVKVGDKKVNAFDVWLESPNRRNGTRLVMDPLKEFGYDRATREINFWQGLAYEPNNSGSWDKLKKHTLEVVAAGDERVFSYLLNWMAYGVQYPDRVGHVAIVLRGGEGTGKGTLLDSFGKLFGAHYLHVMSRDGLTGKFNPEHANKVFFFADEAFFAGDHAAANLLKTMLTEDRIRIEGKHKDPYYIKNHRKVAMASNEAWVVPAGPDSRRFAVFDVGEHRKDDRPYFRAIRNQMDNGGYEAMLYELLNRDLVEFDIWDYPKTDALLDQVALSSSPEEIIWFDALKDGTFGITGNGSWEEELWIREIKFRLETYKTSHITLRALETRFGMHLKKVCPEAKRERRWNEITNKRDYCYVLPTLAKCRKAWSRFTGRQIDWETGSVKT